VKPARGFTLLEAIVALVLLATTGTGLLVWLHTNVDSLHRIQQALVRQQAARNALAWVEMLNPMETPEGGVTVGMYRFEWTSQAMEPPKDGRTPYGGLSNFRVGLYQVTVRVYAQDTVSSASPLLLALVQARQLGYRQVRFPGREDEESS